jgi:hypothetical protein
MTNPLKRGSAPERAQPAHLRPGSFKQGHRKLGGRKRGTPNAISADYKESILEAAFRVGRDGNGKDGIVGYFLWLGERHPEIFYADLWVNLLPFEDADSNAPEEPRRTIDEINQRVGERIGPKGKSRARRQTVRVKSKSPWDWTGQPFPVGDLMQLAVADPKAFCRLIVAAFLRPPTKRQRGLAARRAWEQRERAGASDDAGPH